MSSKKELFLLLLSDIIFVNLSWSIYYYIRIESGWILYTNPPSFFIPMVSVFCYWLIFFYFFGFYKHWFVRSRFDEFTTLFRVISFGCLILFFAIFLDDYYKEAKINSRFLILIYWGLMIFWVSLGRMIIRGFQFRMLKKGYGLRNTLIIGSGLKAKEVKEMIFAYPKLGYKFSGFISIKEDVSGEDEIGLLKDLHDIVGKHGIDEVIIASDQKYEELIISTLNVCSDLNVSVKIVPEVYEIVSGMVRSEQVHGIPLVEVKTDLMPFTSTIMKRIYDLTLSLAFLLVLSPLLLLIALFNFMILKKVFVVEEKIGKSSKNFRSIKFYTTDSGYSKFLRMLWLDKVPQLINVFFNQMSLVGPEPEKVEVVKKLTAEIPYYSRRMKVKPGITGWAQIKQGHYEQSEYYVKKLQYDFYYLENMSLMLDFKIILNTIILIFSFKSK
ncbi:MAG: sugar transferase [Ignavibacteriae bacterium]|nr:sugar transferase [Ignavibacteriota bacterium]